VFVWTKGKIFFEERVQIFKETTDSEVEEVTSS
jgi:hypothetical protein